MFKSYFKAYLPNFILDEKKLRTVNNPEQKKIFVLI